MPWIWTYDVKSQQCIYFTLPYSIIELFGACACSWKNMFWELIENVGAPVLFILRLSSVLPAEVHTHLQAHAPKSATIR